MVIWEVCSCINWQENIRGSQDRSIYQHRKTQARNNKLQIEPS